MGKSKKCPRCGKRLPSAAFSRSSSNFDGLQRNCKKCMAEYSRASRRWLKPAWRDRVRRQRARNQRLVFEFLRCNPCRDCLEPDPVVLEFDHVGPKRLDIATMIHRPYSWQTIRREMFNCEVRCANCHSVKTAKAVGIWERKHMTLHMPSIWETDRVHNCDVRAVSSVG